MKLICQREPMAEAFAKAATFCPRKTDRPILSCVKLSANGAVTLTATDCEDSCKIDLPAGSFAVDKPGSALLYPDRFGALLKEMPDSEIRIEQAKQRVTITSDRGKFNIDSEPIIDYPDPAFKDFDGWSVNTDALRAAVSRVSFAVDDCSKSYALGSVLFEESGNALNIVAADGRTLAHQSVGFSGTCKSKEQILPRATSVQKLVRSLPKDQAAVVGVVGNDFAIRGDGFCYSARLAQGRFPRWRDVFPRDSDSFTAQSGHLLSLIRQVAIVASRDEVNGNRIDLIFTAGSLAAKVVGSERGEGELEMAIAFDGKPAEVQINHHLLLPWLSAIGPDVSVQVTPGDGESAVLLECSELSSRYVVMPLSKDR